MPKDIPGIPTDQLLRELTQLDGLLQITPQQAAIILSRTPKQLSDDRAAGRPPPFTKVGGSNRYSIGSVRDYIKGNTFKSTAQATQAEAMRDGGLMPASFSAFINEGGRDDKWPFMLVSAKPVEFFYSLASGVSDDATCEWLTLNEYLSARQTAALQEHADREDAAIRASVGAKPHLKASAPKKPPPM